MTGGFGVIVGGRDLARYSKEQIHDACVVQWQAEMQASLYWPGKRQSSTPWVPPQWTAWLLMEKAGMPRDLIAYVCHVDPRALRKRLLVTTALMLFPPYAARIEALMHAMPRFGATQLPALRPVREAQWV